MSRSIRACNSSLTLSVVKMFKRIEIVLFFISSLLFSAGNRITGITNEDEEFHYQFIWNFVQTKSEVTIARLEDFWRYCEMWIELCDGWSVKESSSSLLPLHDDLRQISFVATCYTFLSSVDCSSQRFEWSKVDMRWAESWASFFCFVQHLTNHNETFDISPITIIVSSLQRRRYPSSSEHLPTAHFIHRP